MAMAVASSTRLAFLLRRTPDTVPWSQLPATTVGECRRCRSLRRHKGGPWIVRLIFRPPRIVAGWFFGWSKGTDPRTGGRRPKDWSSGGVPSGVRVCFLNPGVDNCALEVVRWFEGLGGGSLGMACFGLGVFYLSSSRSISLPSGLLLPSTPCSSAFGSKARRSNAESWIFASRGHRNEDHRSRKLQVYLWSSRKFVDCDAPVQGRLPNMVIITGTVFSLGAYF